MNHTIDDRDINWVLPLVRDAAVGADDPGPGDRPGRPTMRPAGRVVGKICVVEVGGLRDRLTTSPSVTAFPEVFGIVQRG